MRVRGPLAVYRNTWRYIGAIILVMIPVIIAFLIVAVVFLSTSLTGGGPPPTLIFRVVGGLTGFALIFFATAVGITVLSIFYRHIVGVESGESSALARLRSKLAQPSR